MSSITRRQFLECSALAALSHAGSWPARAERVGTELARLDALAQAELVRTGKVSPLELVEAAIRRIEEFDPPLNSVPIDLFDRARVAARGRLPDGPLRGVPYLAKDVFDLEGTRNTYGSRLFAQHVSKVTDADLRCAIDAGAVIVGKSNAPEYGMSSTTEPTFLKACHNPWNLEHSAGGSSGGAAAAVAAGLVPFAHGSDGGGSIRIPASCCGVFGMKPSRMRANLEPLGTGGLSVELCLSRSVRDSALLLSLVEDRGPGAKFPPAGFVREPVRRRLRIAFSTTGFMQDEPHAHVRTAIEATAKLCESLGHEVIPVRSPVIDPSFRDHYLTVFSGSPVDLVRHARERGLDPAQYLDPWTIGLVEHHSKLPAGAMQKALAYFKKIEADVARFFAQGYDAWLTPVAPTAPPRLGEQAPTVPFEQLVDIIFDYVSHTPIQNVAGTPAMSVPLGHAPSGLPIGSHFSAAAGQETVLLGLAYQLEEAAPWGDRWPRYSAVRS